ncbi:small conductance mechanosensitive channel [Desulfonatronum thiosulfatophilum]|uniref:Small conductance mechanosensitive channel n=1 Tax=Desulfonatronum thiosulfatophilum TaxID=617002 RepID=A0A1G6AVB9_9BACT|nr:mechanosensitive ion channel domain-containing protein [Desulfonatronum thiosulfatophilum]SDB12356.1 small conductance mechanosensitive channel [Desulfonatronum thiosulfatophilum]
MSRQFHHAGFMIAFFLSSLMIVFASVSSHAQQTSILEQFGGATSSATQPDMTQAGIERLLRDLENPEQLNQLKENLRLLLAAQAADPASQVSEPEGLVAHLLSSVSESMRNVNRQFAASADKFLEIPSLLRELAVQAQDPAVLRTWGEMTGKIILVLLVGWLAQVLVSRLLGGMRKALEDRKEDRQWFRTLLLFGRSLLDLIPIIAFGLAAYGVLTLLDPRVVTRLVALTLVNSSVLVRVILTFTRLVLVPGVPSLSILPMRSESRRYFYIWMRRVVRIGVYGYFLLEAALILGIPASLHHFLLKMLGLIITLMVIIFILQNRADVASWLRRGQSFPDQEASSASEANDPIVRQHQVADALRRRLAEFWHILAVMIVVGIYGTWVLEVEGGAYFVVRAVIMTMAIVALTAFLDRMSRRGINRLFKISDELKEDHPLLEARANRYLPLFRHTINILLYIVAFFSIMQIWGMGAFNWLLSPQGSAIISSLLFICLIIAGTFLLWELISARIEISLDKERRNAADRKSSTRALTLLPMLSNVFWIVLVIIAGMSVLAHLGFNIAPLLAGAGVIGLAVGFGAQTLVRDVISGAFILLEDSIAVGDWVEAGGHSGTVEHLTIRTVTLRDLAGTVNIIPFGEVSAIRNFNRGYGYALIDAGVAYREDYGEVVQALQDVAAELRQDPVWGPDILEDLEVFGLNNLSDSAVEIRVRLKTMPSRQFTIRRAFLQKMKRIFDERGIEIPFPHQTIWFGEDKKGFAPPIRVIRESKDHRPSPPLLSSPGETREKQEIQYTSESQASKEVVREQEKSELEREEIERVETESKT